MYTFRVLPNALFLVLLSCFYVGITQAQMATQSFSDAGTFSFTVPPGVTSLTVQAWGGGGGARGDGSSERGGGGGGAFAQSDLAVSPGQIFTVVVGAGGVATSNPGQSGQNSVFGNNLVKAAGGIGGTDDGGAGGTIAASIGTIRFAGGAGGKRGSKGGGGGGGSAFTNANGANGADGSGDIGGAGGNGTGKGGNGGNKEMSGVNGFAPGGGGGGRGYKGHVSGKGADGKVVVSWLSEGADMSVVKTVSTSTPVVGQAINFTLTVKNRGPVNASGVLVSDLLPSGFTLISVNPAVGSYTSSTGKWVIGTLATDSTTTMEITAIVNDSGNYTNKAVVSAEQSDPDPLNNTSAISVTICKAGSSTPFFN